MKSKEIVVSANNTKIDRPSWDEYFLSMCYLVAQRSLDKHTKCGCVAINKDKAILSTGYNSPPRGYPDEKADLERPGKYIIMEHAERNMVANAARIGVSLLDSIVYVTGPPCSDCYRILWNAGAKQIIVGNNQAKMTDGASHITDVSYNTGPEILTTQVSPILTLEKALEYAKLRS